MAKLADFCPLKMLVSESVPECQTSPGVTVETLATVSFFSRKPSAQTLGSPGTLEQHPFSEEIKGDAGWSSWYFLLCSQQGPAAVLCSSPALPFLVRLCSPLC